MWGEGGRFGAVGALRGEWEGAGGKLTGVLHLVVVEEAEGLQSVALGLPLQQPRGAALTCRGVTLPQPGGCGRPQPGRRCVRGVRGRGRIISERRIARHLVGALRNTSACASRSASVLRVYRAGSACGFPSLEGSVPSRTVAE